MKVRIEMVSRPVQQGEGISSFDPSLYRVDLKRRPADQRFGRARAALSLQRGSSHLQGGGPDQSKRWPSIHPQSYSRGVDQYPRCKAFVTYAVSRESSFSLWKGEKKRGLMVDDTPAIGRPGPGQKPLHGDGEGERGGLGEKPIYVSVTSRMKPNRDGAQTMRTARTPPVSTFSFECAQGPGEKYSTLQKASTV
ncbi:hypothetical protein L249_0501, partial [Ophiocordyceps polyrhachis-furcata BCC 54312]